MHEIVMGLEVHAELSTKSKIFCGCSTEFGCEPNTQVCPVCSGMPGALPKLNKAVVEYAMKLGLALGCEITRDSKFDRKNYFYPDLPKAYQTSQLYSPICTNGSMDIGGKKIRIREIHMEEDAGKLLHNGNTMLDFNRCGVPLLEIVTQPDFRGADEVLTYLKQLRETLLYLDVCDCKMQEGSLRADVNLSVKDENGELGTRTEMKNLNSFKAIGRAIEYEAKRQIELIKRGGRVIQETRRWDDEVGESYGMRSKENAQDYRYFPEPDLLPIHIDDKWLERVKNSLPELPVQKRERYIKDLSLSEKQAEMLTESKELADLFESVCEKCSAPVEAANMIINEPGAAEISAEKLAEIVALVSNSKINRTSCREVVQAVLSDDVDVESYITEKGLLMVEDNSAVIKAINEVMNANPEAIADYHSGKEKAFGFLMGQIMRKLGKTANPETVNKTLKQKLQE